MLEGDAARYSIVLGTIADGCSGVRFVPILVETAQAPIVTFLIREARWKKSRIGNKRSLQ